MFKIGELSKRTNLSVPTIRFYEEKGLIYPVNVDSWTGYRYYDDSSVERIQEIAYFKNLGFSLDEILNIDEQLIKNKIEQTRTNIDNLTKNISILSSINKDEGDRVMTKKEIVKQVLNLAEENHINLFHSVDKAKVYNYIEDQNWENMDDKEFDGAMLKLFAMFSDSQTTWSIKYIKLDKKLEFLQDKIYIEEEGVFNEVVAFEQMSVETFKTEVKKMIAFSSDEGFVFAFRDAIKNGYYYDILGLMKNNAIKVVVKKGGKEESINLRAEDIPITASGVNPYYYQIKNDNILYIRVRRCINSIKEKFDYLVESIAKEIKQKNIKNFILDVRANRGGNSEILKPLYYLIMANDLKGVVLIDNLVAGASLFFMAKLKKDGNVIFVGEHTADTCKRYGNTKHLDVENYHFTVSTKFFDISEVFGYQGAIKPDIYVPLSIEDIQNQNDRQLKAAIAYFAK